MEDKFHKTQLCWTCARACGGCSWSRSFTPVNGWTAEQTELYVDRGEYETHRTTSYKITACPLYKNDAPQERKQREIHIIAKPIVKRPKRPCVMRGTLREKIWALPDLKERIERLTGELKTAAELAFLYNYNGDDAAEVMCFSKCGYVRRLTDAMKEMEAMT